MLQAPRQGVDGQLRYDGQLFRRYVALQVDKPRFVSSLEALYRSNVSFKMQLQRQKSQWPQVGGSVGGWRAQRVGWSRGSQARTLLLRSRTLKRLYSVSISSCVTARSEPRAASGGDARAQRGCVYKELRGAGGRRSAGGEGGLTEVAAGGNKLLHVVLRESAHGLQAQRCFRVSQPTVSWSRSATPDSLRYAAERVGGSEGDVRYGKVAGPPHAAH